METYLKAVKLFRHDQDSSGEPAYSQVCVGALPRGRPPGCGRQLRACTSAAPDLLPHWLSSGAGGCSEGRTYVRHEALECLWARGKCSVNVIIIQPVSVTCDSAEVLLIQFS